MELQSLIQATMASPPALIDADGTPYPTSRQDYQKIKHFLLANATPAAPVGILLAKDPMYVLTLLACMELGVPYVPLNPHFPKARLAEIQQDAGITLLIDQALITEVLASEQLATPPTQVFDAPLPTNHPLYIIFTSGSTGRPKGVVISRAAFTSYLHWLNDYTTHITAQHRVLQVTEFTFDISLIDIILFLCKKTPLYFTAFNGMIFKLAQEIEQHKITTISTVPNNIIMLLSDFIVSKSDFSHLQHLMIGGARFSFGLYQKVCQHFSNLVIDNFYGPTEFTIYSHAKRIQFSEPSDCEDHVVSIGVPNRGVEAKIFANDRFAECGQRGELLLCGEQIMNEYISNPEKTSQAIQNIDGISYYKTGDLAYQNQNGECFVVGRMDDTIKYRGYRINLLDIDSYIARLSYIQEATTIAVPDDIRENLTVCFIIRSITETELSPKQVRKDLEQFLVDYQIPEKIIFIDQFPVNTSGKVCKKTLLKMYQNKEVK